MKNILVLIILLNLFLNVTAIGQGNQTVSNGEATSAVNFAPGCSFNWVNDNPTIGLPASGTGDISSFIARNTGSTPITATIRATPGSGGFVYISNKDDNTVSVIRIADNKVVATIPVQSDPTGMSITADGTRVFVSNSFSRSVSMINAVTNTLIKNIPVIDYSISIRVNKDGSRLYVANYNAKTVSVINTTTNAIIANIPAGYGPFNLCISPDDSRLYVTNNNYNTPNPTTVTVINTLTNSMVTQITVGVQPEGVTINKDGSRVYVTNEQSNTVSVINTATNTVIETIPVGVYPHDLALSPDDKTLYTRDYASNQLVVTNLSTKASTRINLTGVASQGVGISSDGLFVYIPNPIDNNVSVVNTSINKEVAVIPVGRNPSSTGEFVSAGIGCSPVTFTITVNPDPLLDIGNVSGSITSCSGTASTSTQQFLLSGSYLKANVSATAPVGFEISTSPNSNYGSTLNLSPIDGVLNSLAIYVRSGNTAQIGNNVGNIVISSKGVVDKNAAVSATINAVPKVDFLTDQEVKTGISVSEIKFTGTADNYTWKNSLPQIGLAANGTDNIPAFTAANNGTTDLTAIITITPINTNGCEGSAVSFKIKVNPETPTIPNQPTDPNQSTVNIIIPNAFTPNGDGINDTWEIKNIANYVNATVKIYNRYGQVVYLSKGYAQPWNGKENNKNLPIGTYYYVIDPNENDKAISGYVTIVR